MKKENENSSEKVTQIIALIIYVIAVITIFLFLRIKINGQMQMEVNSGKYEGMALAQKQGIISATSGMLSQIQVLLSAFVVLAVPKKGYITAMAMNIFLAVNALMGVIRVQNIAALPGTIVPVSTAILITIVFMFSNKLNQKNAELSKNYNELMETNRIIREKDEKLSYLAYYDILTSLPNRHLFIEKIDETIINNSNMPFTVILADLDDFKQINNIYSSSSGDALLATYAEKLKVFCGDSIFLSRIGGNEYGFIIQGNMSEANILNYIEKIQNIISEPVQIGNDMISSTASYGIASYPVNAVNSSDILKCINSAVSYAKANGKNRPCFYEQY